MTNGLRNGLIVGAIGAVLLLLGFTAEEGYGEMERNLGVVVTIVGLVMVALALSRQKDG